MNSSEPIVETEKEIQVPPAQRPKRRKGWVLPALAVLVAFGYLGISPRLAQNRKLLAQTHALEKADLSVAVIHLKPVEGTQDLTLPANIQAVEQTTVNAHTSGYVKERFVDIGSRVKAGDVLAVIESPEVDQQVAQSQAEVSKAQASVGQAEAEVSRSQAVIVGARSDRLRYVAGLGQAKADLAHLQAKYSQSLAAVDVARARLTESQKKSESAQAALTRAKVAKSIAGKTLARWKELEKSDAVSGQDVDEKQSTYDSSLANVSASEADVSSADAEVQASTETVKSLLAEVQAARADIESGREKVQAAQAAIGSSDAMIQSAIAASRASRSNVSAAQAAVGSNEAGVRRYAALQGYERVLAPFSGVITARNVDTGDLVNAATGGSGATDQTSTVTRTGLFGLARTDVLLAQVNVPEDSVANVALGQDASIQITEYPKRTFSGKVSHVSGALDAASRTLMVEVSIPNNEGLLKPGMYAQIRFLGSRGSSSLRIPATALMFDAKGTRVVEVTENRTLHFIPVTLGRDFGNELEVIRGLTGKEVLVSNPDDSMKEGQKVKPVEAGQ